MLNAKNCGKSLFCLFAEVTIEATYSALMSSSLFAKRDNLLFGCDCLENFFFFPTAYLSSVIFKATTQNRIATYFT